MIFGRGEKKAEVAELGSTSLGSTHDAAPMSVLLLWSSNES